MSWQSDIFSALTADTGITAIVGDRIFSDVADGSTAAPYLVWQVIATNGETTHDGERTLDFPLVQFSCWAQGRAVAIQLAQAVDFTLDGRLLNGSGRLTLTFSDQHGEHDEQTNLYGEILEFRGACNRN